MNACESAARTPDSRNTPTHPAVGPNMPLTPRGISASLLLAALLFLTMFSVVADDGVGVIVEFFDPPRVLVRSKAATRTIARFRQDVDAIVNARIAGAVRERRGWSIGRTRRSTAISSSRSPAPTLTR
jgi:hypothetical protein